MEKKTIIIAGGAGYIGSCTAHVLREAGYHPIIWDNFSTSARPSNPLFPTYEVELTDLTEVHAAITKTPKPFAIFHFAAKALVSESSERIWDYFHNNLLATLNLAEIASKEDIKYFINSSTCAVYGTPKRMPLKESDELSPLTPYGHSKLGAENILEQFSNWKNLRVLNLRYFNPAGAIPEVGLGEQHEPETHLIPNLVKSLISNSPFEIFGSDYPTPDGTCIRDLIHIRDLAKAHLLGLQFLESHPDVKFETLNIGSGLGTSVKQAVTAAEKTLKIRANIAIRPRRPGDPPELVADNSKMKRLFKWSPEQSLETMIEDHATFFRSKLT